jgi:hypothetical protein
MAENILDLNRTQYVLEKKFNSIVITNENGIVLAKSKGSLLLDNNGSIILEKKEHFNMEINDSNKNLIGIFQSDVDGVIYLRNSKGEDLLIGEGIAVYDTPYGINNSTGNEIAVVTANGTRILRLMHLGNLTLHIKDLSYDRKTLLGFLWYLANTVGIHSTDSDWGKW